MKLKTDHFITLDNKTMEFITVDFVVKIQNIDKNNVYEQLIA